MDLLREYIFHGPQPAIPSHLRLVHFDESATQIGKNFPVEVGVLGDSKSGLAELLVLLDARMTPDDRQQAQQRREARAKLHREAQARLRDQIASRRDARPMHGSVLMESLAGV